MQKHRANEDPINIRQELNFDQGKISRNSLEKSKEERMHRRIKSSLNLGQEGVDKHYG